MKKKEATYEDIIESIGENLPSLPQILDDLVKTLGNLGVTLDLIEEQIRIDQSISLEILKVVNKGEFLEPGEKRITSIHDAIHKLGFENVQKIIMSVSGLAILFGNEVSLFFKVESLWKHCVGVALGCPSSVTFWNLKSTTKLMHADWFMMLAKSPKSTSMP